MKRIKWPKPNTERIILLVLTLLAQLFIIFVFWNNIVAYSRVLEFIGIIFSLVMVMFLIVTDQNPAYRQSWIILIMLFPFLGGVLYFLIGNKKPVKHMRESIGKQETIHAHEIEDVPNMSNILAEKDAAFAGLSRYLRDYASSPLYMNDPIAYYPSGELMMNDLVADLKKAKKTIFVEFFIVEYGVMFDLIFNVLIEKAKEGVEVRFIYDGFGTLTRLPEDFEEYCAKLGIKASCFNRVKPIISMAYNTRDHRKFIIIDNEIAYTGGMNIADEYINVIERFGYWKDNMIRVSGPAVWNYSVMFLNMWNAFNDSDDSYEAFRPDSLNELKKKSIEDLREIGNQFGFVQPFGDSPLDEESVGENVYLHILHHATDYVYIYTPYLVISHEMQIALQMAAKRGVKVKLMTPGIPDKRLVYRLTRSFYRPLLNAGVEIYEYTPGFLHAKSFVSDDKIATVGTSNLDYRSFYLHFETNTVIYYHPVIKDIKADMEVSLAKSRQVSIKDTSQSLLAYAWDAILRLLTPFV